MHNLILYEWNSANIRAKVYHPVGNFGIVVPNHYVIVDWSSISCIEESAGSVKSKEKGKDSFVRTEDLKDSHQAETQAKHDVLMCWVWIT